MASIAIYSGIDEELIEEVSFPQRRCCFWMPCIHCDRFTFSVEPNWWLGTADDGKADGNPWWSKGLSQFKKIKEWSVLVAVPKLKTFIRRFNKQRRPHAKFQYDRASYLLNFDEGPGHLEDDDWLNHNFSTRYSVVSGKPSMDLGENRPAFT
ncbi:unnamed protein product [Lactuca virosa]|uniref:Uncharacterized protein n=1 Tax=Lactuca virosa TaxID=75947 RepID=A0AAU9MD45_9ASTR|nr:unnamed protein product [Lactuca virosa]